MAKPLYKYLLRFKAAPHPDIGYEHEVKYESSDSKSIGDKLVDGLIEYGEIFEVKFSYINCPLCGKCPRCGE